MELRNGWEKIDSYSAWMYHTYEEFVKGDVFDVGAGLGRMVPFYIDKCDSVITSEIDETEIEFAKEKYKDSEKVQCIRMDILTDDYKQYKGSKDTVMCINCLEHIKNHKLALSHMKAMLKPDGYLIIFVPAMQQLYCQYDINVGHFRRYEPGILRKIGGVELEMKVVKNIHFNFFGMFPYYFKGKRKAKQQEFGQGDGFGRTLNEGNGQLINVASRILEPMERLVPPPIGVSELIVFQNS